MCSDVFGVVLAGRLGRIRQQLVILLNATATTLEIARIDMPSTSIFRICTRFAMFVFFHAPLYHKRHMSVECSTAIILFR